MEPALLLRRFWREGQSESRAACLEFLCRPNDKGNRLWATEPLGRVTFLL